MSEFPPFNGSHSKKLSPAGLAARSKMLKSKSQGDSIDNDSPLSYGHTHPPQQHLYEEIQPKLTYVDIDLTKNKRSKDRTAK